MNDLDRLPPQNLDAEQAVIGSVLLDPSCLVVVRSIIATGDFYHPDNQAIFTAMLGLAEEGQPIDLVTVVGKLRASGELERIGGPDTVIDAMERTPSAANVESYAGTVADKARRRRMISAATQAMQTAYDVTSTEEELIQAAGDVPPAAVLDRAGFDLELAVEKAKRAFDPEAVGVSWSSGMPWLDSAIGRIKSGLVWIIAGRSGHMKTALALAVMRWILDAGGKVAMFRYEESVNAVLHRLAGLWSGIPPSDLELEQASPADRERFMATLDWIKASFKGRIGVYMGASVPKVEAVLGSALPHVVIYDTLQAMAQRLSEGSAEKRRDLTVAKICDLAASYAQRYGHTAILVSQLRKGTKGQPTMDDLRESGAIEEGADKALLLWYPVRELGDKADRTKLVIRVGKNRVIGRFPTLVSTLDVATQLPVGVLPDEEGWAFAENPGTWGASNADSD